MSKVTFFTQCWEGDWNVIINQGGLEKKLENLNYHFDKKILIITNVNNREFVESSVKNLMSKNIIDGYYFTDDYSDKVLSHFDIQKESFNGGYWYSIAPLLSIYLCDTDYMIYQTADSLVEKNNIDWISKGIEMLSTNPNIKVVNPLWNNDSVNAEKQEVELNIQLKNDEWWYGKGFSDQCFLIQPNVFKERIYNTQNPLANLHYPDYAGDSFEKRIYSYLITNNYYRITNKQTTYYHPRWS
jgi:hypothetical protein